MKLPLAVLLVCSAWAAFLLTGDSAFPLRGPAVIDITQEQVRHTGQRLAVDDDEFWLYQTYNRRITGAAIGYSVLRCEFYGRGGPLGTGVSDCSAVYAFARGKIVARGILKSRSYYALAIVGGTGIYSNVRGQVLVKTIGSRPHEERLLFGLEV